MAVSQRVLEILSTYSNGEIQSGREYTRYRREYRPKEKRKKGEHVTKVVPSFKKVKGTGIPASLLQRVRTAPDKITLSKSSIKKLVAFDRRQKYNLLRSSGVSVDLAKYYSDRRDPSVRISNTLTLRTVPEIAAYYLDVAREIARGKGLSLDVVLYGLGLSESMTAYWDEYVRTRAWEENMEDSDFDTEDEGPEEAWDR